MARSPSQRMTLGNMRAQGVRSLAVNCWLRHHGAVLLVDPWPDATPVPSFGPRMVTGRGGLTQSGHTSALRGRR